MNWLSKGNALGFSCHRLLVNLLIIGLVGIYCSGCAHEGGSDNNREQAFDSARKSWAALSRVDRLSLLERWQNEGVLARDILTFMIEVGMQQGAVEKIVETLRSRGLSDDAILEGYLKKSREKAST